METDTEKVRRVYARTNPKHWIDINAEDIPPGWIDDMVKRLFEELNRQMIRIERTSQQVSDKKDAQGKYIDDPEEREQHARTLARIQTQLERLTKMEIERASMRVTRKKSRKPSEIRAEIQRAILGAIAPGSASKDNGGAK
jgi:hypothetical protein